MNSLPFRFPFWRRSVEVRTKPASDAAKAYGDAKIRSSPVYAGHAIKPLRKLVSSQSACSLGQDRGLPACRKTPARIPPKAMSFLFPFEQTSRMSQKGMISQSNSAFGMRTRTRQRQPARPESGCLAGLPRLAKSKIQTSFRASSRRKIVRRCHATSPRLV